MSKLTFEVPWSALCSKNAKWIGRYSKVLSPKYRDAMTSCGALAVKAAIKQRWKQTPLRCRVVVEITEPDHLVRDAYNFGECLLDALTKCTAERIWNDDCQARDVRFFFREKPDKQTAGAIITVETL